MPKYKLTYFNIRVRAEVSRILFALAGVEFEDIRLEWKGEDWNALKPSTPFSQLPILEVDGEILCQSHAIEGYLAREFGFAGKTGWDQARAAMIANCVEDFMLTCVVAAREPDENKRKEKMKKVQEEQVPDYLNKFESLLKSNNGGDGYFVGDEITIADLNFYELVFAVELYCKVEIDWNRWMKLKLLKERIENHPKIAEWFKKRPPEIYIYSPAD